MKVLKSVCNHDFSHNVKVFGVSMITIVVAFVCNFSQFQETWRNCNRNSKPWITHINNPYPQMDNKKTLISIDCQIKTITQTTKVLKS